MKNIFIVIFTIFLAACSNNAKQNDTKPAANADQASVSPVQSTVFKSLPPAQAMDLIKQKQDLYIIDIRSPEELREGKIENSTLIPFMDIMKGNYTIPHDRPLLLICAVGGRSYAAMQILAQKGYREIYNLQGGIANWKQANLPLLY